MQDETRPKTKPHELIGLAGAAIVLSAMAALAVLFSIGTRRRRHAEKDARIRADIDLQVEKIPIQPAVDTATKPEVPHHFTENLVVPGLTHTGAEIEQQDRLQGRSPEGV